MPQDAFTLGLLANELNTVFNGGKISRINQPRKDCLSLLIYTANGTLKLTIDLSAKFCRISAGETGTDENPQVAPNFCMLLRKHLQNAEVLAIKRDGFERVVFIDFKCFSEFEITEMRLYLEIMGKYSNAVLVKDGIILGALKTASLETGARRVTLSGAKYRPPEKQDKVDPTDKAALTAAFETKRGDAAKFVADKVAGIAYTTAEDVAEKYGENVTADELYEFITSPAVAPCVVYADGEPVDFKAYAVAGSKPFKTLLEAQACYYSEAVRKKDFGDKKRRLVSAVQSAIKKAEKRLADNESKLAECAKADHIKLCGELITSNIYAVQRGQTELNAVNYYDPNGATVTVALDARLTPSQNAQRYYKKYQKLKRTAEFLSAQKSETQDRLSYLKTIENNLTLAENTDDLEGTEEELISLSLIPKPPVKKGAKKKNETPYRQYLCDGFKIVCGRNNVQNDKLTKGLAPDDIWLHVKSFHSSHVGIICDGRTVSEAAIKFAAEVCARYSEACGRDKVAVDYTKKRFVKKPNGAATGFVVYTDFKTILVAPNAHAEDLKDE